MITSPTHTPASRANTVCTMSPDIAAAYELLQQRLGQAAKKPYNWLAIERYERALNELLGHPDRIGDPRKLANAAWGNAGKVIRARVTKLEQAEAGIPDCPDTRSDDRLFAFELGDFIERSRQAPMDRAILRILLRDGDAHDVARLTGMSLAVASVRVTRARKRALREWRAVA